MKVMRAKARARLSGPLRRAGLVLAGAVMLAGCQTSQYPEIQQTGSLRAFRATDRHPILVEPGQTRLEIGIPGYSRGLTPRQSDQVRAFLADYRSLGEGEIVVTVPSGTANEASAVAAAGAVRDLIVDARIAKTAIRYVPHRGAGAGQEPPIVLSFERYYAIPSECGYWPRNIAHEPYNKPYANFGCATQNNLAAIVSDPRDLVRQRALTEGDAARRFEVFDQYRRGQSTSAERTAEESANVSEVQ
jgi:pilus assembly protein CpaD